MLNCLVYLYSYFAISGHPSLPAINFLMTNVAADIFSCNVKEQELGDMMVLRGKDFTDIGGGFGDSSDFLVVQVALLGMLETIKEAVTLFQWSLLGELKFEIL